MIQNYLGQILNNYLGIDLTTGLLMGMFILMIMLLGKVGK